MSARDEPHAAASPDVIVVEYRLLVICFPPVYRSMNGLEDVAADDDDHADADDDTAADGDRGGSGGGGGVDCCWSRAVSSSSVDIILFV